MKSKAKRYITSTEFIDFPVREPHIFDGERRSPLRCPVALALDEHLGEGHQTVVGLFYIYIHRPGDPNWQTKRVHVPPDMRAYLEQYDRTGEAVPETFQLKIET